MLEDALVHPLCTRFLADLMWRLLYFKDQHQQSLKKLQTDKCDNPNPNPNPPIKAILSLIILHSHAHDAPDVAIQM